jgi:transposase
MKKEVSMEVVNARAAGIDVGSRSHLVAVGQDREDVREFGVYTEDHTKLVTWLSSKGITTIAMESTGSYWQTLFSALQRAGFEVLLVNGRQIKNVKGKTDVKDCQWIQRLHCLGLLTGSFLPSTQVERLRTLQRHRDWLVEECARLSNKMQKSLRLMNVRLDVVLSDVMGVSGRRIIEAILNGCREGRQLAQLAHSKVKKSKEEIAMGLQGNWSPELLFELGQSYDLYATIESKITQCDHLLEKLLHEFTQHIDKRNSQTSKIIDKRAWKHQHKFDVSSLSHQMVGVDLFSIEGISRGTVMTFLSEVGNDIYKFKAAKQFTSWLRLAPNNKISGGKILSSRTPRGKNYLAASLRNAANSIGLMKTGALKTFFSRIAFKKGRAAAITATARKLATIIWSMITRQLPYKPYNQTIYSRKVKESVIFNIKAKMKRLDIQPNEILATFS